MKRKLITLNNEKVGEVKFVLDNFESGLILKEVYGTENYFPKINNNQNYSLKPDDIVIDIGANVGLFTVYAAKLAPKGKVYSFEPVKGNFERLQSHVELNGIKNVVTVNKAVSDKNKKTKIYLIEKNSGGHSINKNKFKIHNEKVFSTEQIECISLKEVFDKYKIRHCSFLKLDCEGEEYKILTKLPESYLNKIDKISLEYHPSVVDVIKLARHLAKNNFRVAISNFGRNLGMMFAWRITKKNPGK